MKIHKSTPIFKQKRSGIIVLIGVLLVGGVALLAASSRYAAISESIGRQYDEAKGTAKVIAADSKASREKRLGAIKKLSSIQVSRNCRGEWWNAWYVALIPSAQEMAKDCNTKSKQLIATKQAAKGLADYLNDDNKVAKTLGVMKIATGASDWQKTALSSAESARRDIEAMSETKENKTLLEMSKEKLKVIIDKWTALSAASAKEDKAAYMAAQSELAQGYADLGAISDVSDAQVEKLVGVLYAQISRLQ